jgi:ABC-type transport system involved in multi-copper enzyme maturation permease subunit
MHKRKPFRENAKHSPAASLATLFYLAGFEYKKILSRKGAVITLILATRIICVSPFFIFLDGLYSETTYDDVLKDREHQRALSGRAIDETLLAEVRDAYVKVSLDGNHHMTPEYQQYGAPYSRIFVIWNWVYDYDLDNDRLQNLTNDDLRNFYEIRHNQIIMAIHALSVSDAAKEKMIMIDKKIETPFVFDYADGFGNLFSYLYGMGILAAFAAAVCLAPVFAGEYTTRTDQLILSSKLGKSKVIQAKLFAAISLSVLYFVLSTLIIFVTCMLIYGFDGANAPLQLYMPFSVYPLTILEAVLIVTACTFLGVFLVVLITLLLSSKLSSPFGVIIIITVLLFMPMLIHIPERIVWLYNLFSLLPPSMMAVWSILSPVPFEIFGVVILPYIFMPVFAILASIIILPLTSRNFRNHQIG